MDWVEIMTRVERFEAERNKAAKIELSLAKPESKYDETKRVCKY